MPSHVLPRCSFEDTYGRRCRSRGLGNPPFCQLHFELLYDPGDPVYETAGIDDPHALLGAILAHPLASQILATIGAYIDRAGNRMDPGGYRRSQRAAGAFRAECPPRPAPPPRPPRGAAPPRASSPPPQDPRVILGFGQNQSLTVAEVKKRQRELAVYYHPDKGGSEEGMRRINAAADALISRLR